MNWGLRIFILYTGFVAMIVVMVGLTMQHKVDLVSKDYYQQELEYQDKINSIERTGLLVEPLKWSAGKNAITIVFPSFLKSAPLSGTVYFFRPSDQRKDYSVPVNPDKAGVQVIPLSPLSRGVYQMKINWQSAEGAYYNEGTIQVP